jgi:hypothetical protein
MPSVRRLSIVNGSIKRHMAKSVGDSIDLSIYKIGPTGDDETSER